MRQTRLDRPGGPLVNWKVALVSACADDGVRQVGEQTVQRRLIDAGAHCEDVEPVAARKADLASTALAQQRAKGNRTRAWLWTPAVRPRSTTATKAAVEELWKEREVFTGGALGAIRWAYLTPIKG
jgi:hypothetical protein